MMNNTYAKELNVFNYDTTITMEFAEEVNMQKLSAAVAESVKKTLGNRGEYVDRWIEEFENCCNGNANEVLQGLWSGDFVDMIPTMFKAVAEAFPTVKFNGRAVRDDLKCFWIDDYRVAYDGNELRITETFMDDENGYFCPKCGCFVAFPYEELDANEVVECDDCEKFLHVV